MYNKLLAFQSYKTIIWTLQRLIKILNTNQVCPIKFQKLKKKLQTDGI